MMTEKEALLGALSAAIAVVQAETAASRAADPAVALAHRVSAYAALNRQVENLSGTTGSNARIRTEAVLESVRQAAESLSLRFIVAEIQILD